MTLGIIRTSWLGTSGGPGLTQLAINRSETDQVVLTTTEAQDAVNAVRAFWDAIKANMPNELTFTVSPVVDQYDYATGDLVASVSAPTPPVSVLGTDTGSYSMASGAKLILNTTKILDGRRVRGGIYLVPMAGLQTTNTGTVASTARTTFNTAANTMRTSLNTAGLTLMVWSRPTSPGPSTDGALSAVTGVETSEKVAILRGRRD
jgi:hypothetical protein